MIQYNDTDTERRRYEVFANPDDDEGGWLSYAEDAQFYLGGGLFPTEQEAIADGQRLLREGRPIHVR